MIFTELDLHLHNNKEVVRGLCLKCYIICVKDMGLKVERLG